LHQHDEHRFLYPLQVHLLNRDFLMYMMRCHFLPCSEWWGSDLEHCSRCPAALTGSAQSRSLWTTRCSWTGRSPAQMIPSGPWNLHFVAVFSVQSIQITAAWSSTYSKVSADTDNSSTLQEVHLGRIAGWTVGLASSPRAAGISSVRSQAQRNLTDRLHLQHVRQQMS
jgi:hypothetical protein